LAGKDRTFLPGTLRIARFLKNVLGSPESIGSFARQDKALVGFGGEAPEFTFGKISIKSRIA
jgi:hypothetical protein